MTVDTINSILFPPFLFILFFSTVSAFISPSQRPADKTGTPKNIQPAIAPSVKLYQPQRFPQTQSAPQSAQNRDRFRMDEVVRGAS